MRIEIDVREKDLIDIIKTINIMNGNHEIIIKALRNRGKRGNSSYELIIIFLL